MLDEQSRQKGWWPQPGTPAPKQGWSRRLSRLTIIAGIVLLALAGGLTWFLVPRAPGGPFTAFPLPGPGSSPESITTGPDGNLWFTELYGNKIGRITTNGTITEFPLPRSGGRLTQITAGPDGNLWFTKNGISYEGSDQDQIERLSIPGK
jgi:streptogramin lyase